MQFESGGTSEHIADHHTGLLPEDANARQRAIARMFAALNTLEPPIVEREVTTYFERDKSWYQERLPGIDERVRDRLSRLSARLGAGDLLMVEVLLRLEGALLDDFPNLCAYVARGQARAAFKRAFAAQRDVFENR